LSAVAQSAASAGLICCASRSLSASLGVPPALLGDRLIEKSESLQLALTDRTGMSPLTVAIRG
jgi:hypothetical protein